MRLDRHEAYVQGIRPLTSLDCAAHISTLQKAPVPIPHVYWVTDSVVHMNLTVMQRRSTLLGQEITQHLKGLRGGVSLMNSPQNACGDVR